MFEQPNLFDAIASVAAKNEGMNRVEANADPQWKIDMINAVRKVASRQQFLTSDDIWKELSVSSIASTHDPKVMGAMVKKAAKLGLITPTDKYVPSTRVVAHARPIRIWLSNLFV